jgi:hypothetical protein
MPEASRKDEADPSIDEVERLWLARTVAGPDSWRARATNAAGLLSAAAAATLAGVFLRNASPSWTRWPGYFAAGFFVVSVTAFLIASVYPAPVRGREQVPRDKYTETVRAYCERETKPIRIAVWIGTLTAVLAIFATGTALAGAFRSSSPPRPIRPARTATVILGVPVMQRLAATCPRLATTFDTRVRDAPNPSQLLIEVPAGSCSGSRRWAAVERTDIVTLTAEGG